MSERQEQQQEQKQKLSKKGKDKNLRRYKCLLTTPTRL
jgi:hypothetical protein